MEYELTVEVRNIVRFVGYKRVLRSQINSEFAIDNERFHDIYTSSLYRALFEHEAVPSERAGGISEFEIWLSEKGRVVFENMDKGNRRENLRLTLEIIAAVTSVVMAVLTFLMWLDTKAEIKRQLEKKSMSQVGASTLASSEPAS